jgi:hypothetical protein
VKQPASKPAVARKPGAAKPAIAAKAPIEPVAAAADSAKGMKSLAHNVAPRIVVKSKSKPKAGHGKKAAPNPVTKAKDKVKTKKSKLVRDSFSMPEVEYAALGEVKKACLSAGIEVRKSDLLRVGIALVRKMEFAHLTQAVAGLTPLKSGRPKKNGASAPAKKS